MKKHDWSFYLIVIINGIIIAIAGMKIGRQSGQIFSAKPVSWEKQIEELKIEYQARQSTYEMDYRTCEIRLQEALDMNEYLKRRIRSFNTN